MMVAERKYAMTKLAAGDYLLPSNDAQTVWRISRYIEGPSTGLEWSRDREVWGVWKARGKIGIEGYIDTADWDRWEFCEGLYNTRAEAVSAALRGGQS